MSVNVPDPKDFLTEVFKGTWVRMREVIDVVPLPRNSFWKWWPTLSQNEPDYKVLVDNFLEFPINPYMCVLAIYLSGYANALEDMMEEKVKPVSQDFDWNTGAPDWLQQLVWEDLAKRFGDKH